MQVFPLPLLQAPTGILAPDESWPGITGAEGTGQAEGPRAWLQSAWPADSRPSPQPRLRRAPARLPASGCAHRLGPGGGRARGAVRGAAGAGWGGGGAGAGRGLQPMVRALSPARGAGGGRLGTGRTWQRAALGAHRRSGSGSASSSVPAAAVVPLALSGLESSLGLLGVARSSLCARGPCAGHPPGNPAGLKALKHQAPGPGPLPAAQPAVRVLPGVPAPREPAGPWSARHPTGR